MPYRFFFWALFLTANAATAVRGGGPAEGVDAIATAVRTAVAEVEPFVVQVQPIGGTQQQGLNARGLNARGPTSGIYLPAQACVVTSSYRTVDAAGLIVFFSDGSRSPATVVASDTDRRITLLRVSDPPATIQGGPSLINSTEPLQVGQTLVAVGRVYRADKPNLAVGILSAKQRLHGRALQTDAATSPANYGGPLVDLKGQIVGVLTPLSPSGGGLEGTGGADGTGWYDSGVGFAVPWPDIDHRLPRLLAGETFHKGRLGLSLRPGNPHLQAPVIAKLHPQGPAIVAGIKVGDTIMSLDDQPTPTKTAFRFALAGCNADDAVVVHVERQGARKQFRLIPVSALPKLEEGTKRAGSSQEASPESDSTEIEPTPPAKAGNAAST